MFFGFVCDLHTAQGLEDRPTVILQLESVGQFPPPSPLEMTNIAQYKETVRILEGVFWGSEHMLTGKPKGKGDKEKAMGRAQGLLDAGRQRRMLLVLPICRLHSCFYFARCAGI